MDVDEYALVDSPNDLFDPEELFELPDDLSAALGNVEIGGAASPAPAQGSDVLAPRLS